MKCNGVVNIIIFLTHFQRCRMRNICNVSACTKWNQWYSSIHKYFLTYIIYQYTHLPRPQDIKSSTIDKNILPAIYLLFRMSRNDQCFTKEQSGWRRRGRMANSIPAIAKIKLIPRYINCVCNVCRRIIILTFVSFEFGSTLSSCRLHRIALNYVSYRVGAAVHRRSINDDKYIHNGWYIV